MFRPPRCPNPSCRAHAQPAGRFYQRRGVYTPRCRPRPIPRFRCKLCGRGFSRQTFRADYYDKRPDLNAVIFSRLCSGGGLRQTARELRIRRRNLEMKLWKMARHLGLLHRNLLGDFARSGLPVEFSLDEQESFEECRLTKPVTVPVLIHQHAFFIVGAAVGTIPPSGRRSPARRRAIERRKALEGKRPNQSREVCAQVLELAAAHCSAGAAVTLRSDLKRTYPGLARAAFGARLTCHDRTSSRRLRNTRNPLHRINLMLAISRDLMGRLRRRSWLATKRRKYLALHWHVLIAYRNYHRPRFNRDRETPAQLLGFLPRALTAGELLSWRQDWGPGRSIHPMSPGAASVRKCRELAAMGQD